MHHFPSLKKERRGSSSFHFFAALKPGPEPCGTAVLVSKEFSSCPGFSSCMMGWCLRKGADCRVLVAILPKMVAISDEAVSNTKWVTSRAYFSSYSKLETSWNHIMVEVGRDLWRSPGPTPLAQAWPPRASFSGLCPHGFWISPRMEAPQPPWATCSSAQSPSQ